MGALQLLAAKLAGGEEVPGSWPDSFVVHGYPPGEGAAPFGFVLLVGVRLQRIKPREAQSRPALNLERAPSPCLALFASVPGKADGAGVLERLTARVHCGPRCGPCCGVTFIHCPAMRPRLGPAGDRGLHTTLVFAPCPTTRSLVWLACSVERDPLLSPCPAPHAGD